MSTYRYSCESFLQFIQMNSKRWSGTGIHPPPASRSRLPSSPYSLDISTYSDTIFTRSKYTAPTKTPSPRSCLLSAGNLLTLCQLYQRHSNCPISLTRHPISASFDPMPPSRHDRRERKGRIERLAVRLGRVALAQICEIAVKFCLNRSSPLSSILTFTCC